MANQSRARSQRDPLDDQTSDRHLLVTVGRLVRGTRREIGWTQVRLGAEAGVSQPMVSLIEGACLPDLTFSTAARLLGALGVDLCIVTQEPLLGDRRRQRDAAHARCVAYVRARLERAGWLTASEVEIGRGRARRWIDVLAFHPVERALLVIEVKTVIDDLGQIERVLSTYERGAWQAAHELGWHPRLVVGCLIALATAAVDARVLANRTAFDLGFPVRSAEFADVISSPASPAAGRGRALALIDP